MSIAITIECLPEPMLVFGSGKVGVDPRSMMTRSGAADKTQGRDIQIGLVGAIAEIEIARKWLPRLNMMAAAHEKNGRRYPDWPGAKHVFGMNFIVEDRFVRVVDQQRLEEILHSAAQVERFDGLLDLYDAKIQGLFGDVRPDCIIVCLPYELADLQITNPRLSEVERMVLEKLQEEESQQYSLFQPSPEELLAAEELRTQADDLLFRTFYRSLKARVITSANAVPIQVIRRDTFLRPDSDPGHSNATRCWNLGTSLFYKAGREPWRPSGLPRNTCFIGISFHHLKRREGDVVFLYLAAVHSGYFLRRQFDYFIDRNKGSIAMNFLKKASAAGHIEVFTYKQDWRVYHLRSRSIYRLLGESESQLRRRKGDAQVRARLMALDYVLEHEADHFLESEADRVRFSERVRGISPRFYANEYGKLHPVLSAFPISFADRERPAQSLMRFAFIDEGLLSIGKFVRFLSEADPLLRAVGNFEVIYAALSDFSLHAARAAFRNRFLHASHRSAGLFDDIVHAPAIRHRAPLQPQFTTLLFKYSYLWWIVEFSHIPRIDLYKGGGMKMRKASI